MFLLFLDKTSDKLSIAVKESVLINSILFIVYVSY
jgi:hypothetical protein